MIYLCSMCNTFLDPLHLNFGLSGGGCWPLQDGVSRIGAVADETDDCSQVYEIDLPCPTKWPAWLEIETKEEGPGIGAKVSMGTPHPPPPPNQKKIPLSN